MSEDPLVVFTGYDITQRVEYEEKLKNIAYNDLQLGVKNYAAFMDDLALFYQNKKSGFACIIAVKNFNNYNVIYGRAQGDLLLQSIASFYALNYSKECFFRIAGAKFALIAKDETQYQRLLNLLNQKIPPEVMGSNRTFLLYIDAVVIEFPRFASQPEMVIHHAEYLLQKTKKIDSSEIIHFQRVQQKKLDRNSQIALTIRKKLNKQEFEVYYQPIYDIKLNCFGTGYSSLSYVGTLPVESIKLDKIFVDKVISSEVYVLIVKNVIEIAKGLHLKIVAEGVESQAQFELLKRLNCDYIQGFLFSKPLPRKAFERFLDEQKMTEKTDRLKI